MQDIQTKKVVALKGDLKSLETGLQNQAARTDEWSLKLVTIGKDQDRQAFISFFEHFAPMLKGYFLSNGRTPMSANMIDELIQEVMLKVWTKASQFNPDKAAASTWLFTMARNTRIDMLRRQARHNTEVLETEDVWATEEEESPVALLQQQRDKKVIGAAIEQLPPEQSQIVRLIYMEGKTHSIVAEELELPLGTVKSRLRLALAKMKIQIAQSANAVDL